MDDSLEQPSALRYVETRTTTGEHAQNGISDERLAEITNLLPIYAPNPSSEEVVAMARELTALRARCEAAEKREADLIVSDASMVEALCKYRASHKRLVGLLNTVCVVAQNAPVDGCTIALRFLPQTIRLWEAALAEARKLEGK